MEECFNNCNKESHKGRKKRKKIQCALNALLKVRRNNERKKAMLHIQALPQNAKVEICKEQGQKEYVHFMLNLILKMLNLKVESCKKQVAKENSYALRIQNLVTNC